MQDSCLPAFEHYGPRHWVRPRALAGVHTSEVAPQLASRLIDDQLAVPARGVWLAMHPERAWIYKCQLTRSSLAETTLSPPPISYPRMPSWTAHSSLAT